MIGYGLCLAAEGGSAPFSLYGKQEVLRKS